MGTLKINGNIEGSYIKTTDGGFIKGLSDTPLVIEAGSRYGKSYIGFRSGDQTILGYYGVNQSKEPVFYDSQDNVILHASNYSSYAVPISGGTMTGTLHIENHTQNNKEDALLLVSHYSTNEWNIKIDCNGENDYGLYINCGPGNHGLELNGGLKLYPDIGYGSSFPSNPVMGRIFFKI